MARNKNGLDLSGVGGKKLRVGGGSRPRPGLSFSSQPSLNSKRSQKVMPGSGKLSDGAGLSGGPGNKKSTLLIVLGIVVALAISVAVGVVVYNITKHNDLKPAISATALQSILTPSEEGDIVWNLLLVTEDSQDGEGASVKEACLIAADSGNSKISYLWIPNDVRVYVAGYGYKTVADAYRVASIDVYIKALSDLTGVTFSHFFLQTDKGLQAYLKDQGIDALGDRSHHVTAVTKKLIDSGTTQVSTQVELLREYTATDLEDKDLEALLQSLSGIDVTQGLFCEEMPLAEQKTEEGFSQMDAAQWATVVKRVGEGLDPVAGDVEIDENNRMRSSCSVTIWNGVGVAGVASDCADHLKSKGWNIQKSGNAASFVYDETLVVYNYDSERAMAELLVSDLGQGRVVQSAARYSFEGDVLVVVGKDYQPY